MADSFRSDYQGYPALPQEISHDLRAMLEFVLTGKRHPASRMRTSAGDLAG